jgi:hypothetical protein
VTAHTLASAVALAVALTFATSAVAKLRDPAGFAHGVARYGILPSRILGLVAAVIIAAELLVALAFATGLGLTWAGLGATVLLLSFAFGIAVNLRRGTRLPCMCFGSRSEDLVSGWSLIRIGLLSAGVVLVLVAEAMPRFAPYRAQGAMTEQIFLALTLAGGAIALSRWLLAAPALRALIHPETDT